MTITRIGTPSSRPHTPHGQPKASTPTNTASGLMRLVRLSSQGVSRLPLSVCTPRVPNCTKLASAEAAVTTTAPKQDTKFSTKAAAPHTGACCTPSAQ